MHGAFSMPKRIFAMYEHQKILNKIEKLVDQLPYRSVRIEVEMKDQTLVLSKEKQSQIGFVQTN